MLKKSVGLGGWRSSKPGAFCRWRILRPCHERSLFWWWRWIRCWWVCSLREILERPCLVWGPRPQRFWRDAGYTQVWQLILFLWKIIDLPGGQSMTPSSRKRFSLLFIPSTLSSPSWTLEGLFELTRCPSRALRLASCVVPELQRNNNTVRCAVPGRGIQGHRQEQPTLTLMVCLLKTHLLTPILDSQKSTE